MVFLLCTHNHHISLYFEFYHADYPNEIKIKLNSQIHLYNWFSGSFSWVEEIDESVSSEYDS